MLKSKKILITGGAGFIGTSLAERLVDDNQVVIFDNFHRDALQYTELAKHPNLKIYKGSVLDTDKVKVAISHCDMIIHLAAIAGVDTVLTMPAYTMKVAMIGTYNLLEASIAKKGVEKFIDFSTSEVFGSYAYKVQEGDVTSLGAVGEARWTYAVSKLATEHMAFTYHKQFGLPALSIRPFNIYGPMQVGEGAIHHFIVKALKGEDLTIHNDGSQIRSWCYISDIVDGVLLCLEKEEAVGEAFNIGNPRSTITIYNLAREIIRLADSRSKIVFAVRNQVDVELRIPDIDKAKKFLGYEPKIDLEEGLRKTISWYKEKI